jgi:hypothetical protein
MEKSTDPQPIPELLIQEDKKKFSPHYAWVEGLAFLFSTRIFNTAES